MTAGQRVFVAATGQNRGKTTASLGLFDLFLGRGLDAGFMKPVGQRTIIEDGVSALLLVGYGDGSLADGHK